MDQFDQFAENVGDWCAMHWSRFLNMCIRGDMAGVQAGVEEEQAFVVGDARLKQAAFETAVNCCHFAMAVFIYGCPSGGAVEVTLANVLSALDDEHVEMAEFLFARAGIGLHDMDDYMYRYCSKLGRHNARAWLTSLEVNYDWGAVPPHLPL